MKTFDAKKILGVLRVLRSARRPLGGTRVAQELQALGLNLQPRATRLYLEHLTQQGFVENVGPRGRQITPRGIQELQKASIIDRVGFTAARVDALAYQTTFRLGGTSGRIVVNASVVDRYALGAALRETEPVFRAGLGMGHHIAVAKGGEEFGDVQVPADKALIATVCSVTLNGMLLAAGIPVTSRFGGVLELQNSKPACFTDVIHYDGTSLDPLEIFIKGRLTSVAQAARTGRGRIGVSFREIPSAAVADVQRIARKLQRVGLNGILMIGRPNQPLLDFPVPEGRTGMIVAGGLNPMAAIEESGIPTTNFAMHSLVEFERFRPFNEVLNEL